MSKSAKKRAAKTARDANYAGEQAPAPAVAEKASAPKAAAKKAAQAPAPAKAEAKAQAKPAAKKQAGKADGAAPLKQQQKEFVAPVDGPPVQWDNGDGDDWGMVAAGAKGK